ncbi:MAG: serine/threonine-protein kinase [Gemmatimonadota bacterium]
MSNADDLRDKDDEAPPPDPGRTMAWTPEELAEMQGGEAAGEGGGGAHDAAPGEGEEDPLVGKLLREKWKVLERLGAGSFGTVYKVQDVKGGWIEALKILGVDRITGAEAETARKRFLREAQIMKRLGTESSHIVGLSTYEEDLEGGMIYFLMEFVEGKSLADALAEEGPFSVERTIRLALQVCEALTVAHEGPDAVVHRDLKLENLMLTRDRAGQEIVKVLDFGIAKLAEKEADSRLTTVGTLGTPGYAAPEQIRAEDVDARTDLFAFGVILYSLLTGRDPWLGNPASEPTHQIYELMAATDRGRVLPMSECGVEVPEAMEQVVLRLLRRNPQERFQSARELREALAHIAAGGSPQRAGGGREARPRAREAGAPSRRRPLVVAAGAVALVLLAGALWLQPWGRSLETAELEAAVARGAVADAVLADDGIHGLIARGPVRVPFTLPLSADAAPEVLRRLREEGLAVDPWPRVARLLDEVARAQKRQAYFGSPGSDVASLARRIQALDPESPEARSLLRKVGERMSWDAEAAAGEGDIQQATSLVSRCLELVPDHPSCLKLRQGS